ncbi:hypothetical protein BP5796_11835 [Coleophoma crateriformis]|uniref:Prion-inhibition and propagation HeLo domain-containing protein n=1 Tax=Coleophoma crateriformis TaxID=565419 RepID=A0A3D8QEI3_9HELO|nr:hypothetical protein BP5796_11835 [Coleophoma crateriformis]
MAEAFGIVAGAAGLAAAFEPCVQCFLYIQLARNFGKDFATCQIKLDVLRVRLTRWGLAVGLGENPNPQAPAPVPQITATEKEVAVLKEVLQSLQDDLEEARRKSEKVKGRLPESTAQEIGDPDAELSEGPRRIHQTLAKVFSRRDKCRPNLLDKASWALYRKGDFENLIDDITTHMGNLESVFPAMETAVLQQALVQTSKQELSSIDDKEDLKLLSTMAGTSDIALVQAVNDIIKSKGDTWRNIDVNTTNAFNHLGHNFGSRETWSGSSTWERINITGSGGKNHLGHNINISGVD